MSVEVEKEMLNAILAARDEEYADFTAKLIPNVPRESIIGVRTPQLRSIAKRFGKNAGIDEFLSALPHEYHEQNLVHAYIAESIGDFDFAVKTIDLKINSDGGNAKCVQTYFSTQTVLQKAVLMPPNL